MAEKYSELEVAPNEHREPIPEAVDDQAAQAPERDLSSDAPELDRKSWAPQVCRNTYLSFYGSPGLLLSRVTESSLYLGDSWPRAF